MAFSWRTLMGRRQRMAIRTDFTTGLARLATSVVHGVMTMNMTHMLVGFAAAPVLSATAVLVLFSLVNDVRTRTRINFMRCLIVDMIAVRRRFYLTTLLVLRTRVMVVNTSMMNTFMFMMTVVVCLVTLHGSLLRSCSTG